MAVPNISGGWLSKEGRLVYIITQVGDKFIWQVIHKNGITETGIGWFLKATGEDMNTTVEVQWNFNGGHQTAHVHHCSGTVIIVGGRATEIRWKDGDDFQRVS